MDRKNKSQSQNTLTYPEIAYNCQINYIIIDKLWHYFKKSPQDLYFELGITGNKYSKIRTGECPLTYLKNIWNEQESSLKKLGLPEEIMLGEAVIEIKGISKEDWDEYILFRRDRSNNYNNKKNKMRNFDNKLKKAFSELTDDRKPTSNIGKLYYFIKHGVAVDSLVIDREMKELQAVLKTIKTEHIKTCNKKLREDIEHLMKEILYEIDIVIAYNNLK